MSKISLLENARNYIRGEASDIDSRLAKVGFLPLLKESGEFKGAQRLLRILEDYGKRQRHSRPLCFAVFGPPGSGKSTLIKAIINDKSISDRYFFVEGASKNLTKVASPNEFDVDPTILSEDKIPVIFYDEFDANMGEQPLGWIKSFLSPMQDGLDTSSHDEKAKPKRAVLIFAGGTSSSMEDFRFLAESKPEEARRLKVPDFISRLHGFVDIQGLNGEEDDRILRRTLAIKYLLSERELGSPITYDDDVLDDFLLASHFIHNNRSLQAILDTSCLTHEKTFDRSKLPDDDSDNDAFLRLHLSRGTLEGKRIGISTWQGDKTILDFTTRLSKGLFLNGAGMAYGGELEMENVLSKLIASVSEIPDGFLKHREKAIHNYLAYPSFLRDPVKKQIEDSNSPDIDFFPLETLSDEELDFFGLEANSWFPGRPIVSTGREGRYDWKRHIAWSLSLFRMRLRMISDTDALVVVGGKAGLSWGRSLGIAEEVMIAMKLKKPVYIVGGFGGGSEIVGRALGLGETVRYAPDYSQFTEPNSTKSRAETDFDQALKGGFSRCFQIPMDSRSPVSELEIMAYLEDNPASGSSWTDNGLTQSQNRQLFMNDKIRFEETIDLIIKGLKRTLA